MSEFDYGADSEKLGDSVVPGVLKLKDGDERTLLIMGPLVPCMDRFKDDEPVQKFCLGVYVYDTHERGVVLYGWKLKKAFDAENKARSFKTHFVRFSRRGSKKEDTSYGVAAIPGVTPAHWAEANAATPLQLGSVQAVADAITANANKPRRSSGEGAPPAAGQGYPHPGNGHTTPSYAPVPGVPPVGGAPPPPSPTSLAPVMGSALAVELRKIDGWLQAPGANVDALSKALREKLLAGMGKEAVLGFVKKAGIVTGAGAPTPTGAQLRAVIANAIAVLEPAAPPVTAAAMGVADDDIPF